MQDFLLVCLIYATDTLQDASAQAPNRSNCAIKSINQYWLLRYVGIKHLISYKASFSFLTKIDLIVFILFKWFAATGDTYSSSVYKLKMRNISCVYDSKLSIILRIIHYRRMSD